MCIRDRVKTNHKNEGAEKESTDISDVIKTTTSKNVASEERGSKEQVVTNNVEDKKDNVTSKASQHEEKDKGRSDSSELGRGEKSILLPASEGKTRTDLINVQNAEAEGTRKLNEIKQEDKSKLPGTQFDTNIIKTLEVSTTENQSTSKMSQNNKESKIGETDVVASPEPKETGDVYKRQLSSSSYYSSLNLSLIHI